MNHLGNYHFYKTAALRNNSLLCHYQPAQLFSFWNSLRITPLNETPADLKNSFSQQGITNKLILLFLFCCAFLFVYPQSKTKTEPAISKTGLTENSFPQSFIGNWKGQLQWLVAGKPTQQFTMQLGIQPANIDGQYTWQIIYGDSVIDNRPYILKPVDAALGHWIIDERDGIVLDSYVHGNAIHGAFTLQGKTIVDNYRVEKDQLFVEFFTINLKDKKRSGKGTEKTPFVDSYRMGSYQMGTLFRMK
jgi:hypothetical protein